MKEVLFGDLEVGDVFAYGSKVYAKRKGVCQGVDYNAEDVRNGDFWQFDVTDVTFFIKKEELVTA